MLPNFLPKKYSALSIVPKHYNRSDHSLIEHSMYQLPKRFRPSMAIRYSNVFNKLGPEKANETLVHFATQSKIAGVTSGLISDSDIIFKANRISQQVRLSYARHGYTAALHITLLNINEHYLPCEKKHPEEKQRILRLSDEKWWRRTLRKQRKRAIEEISRGINLVNSRKGLYVTDASVKLRETQLITNRTLLEECIAVNELGQEFTLAALSDLSVSNPSIKRAELMVRLSGFDAYAKINNQVGDFWTLTCPSKMHSSHKKSGRMNPKFDGITPRDAQKHLNQVWSRARAQFKREGIDVSGMRVAEPNHDGTPHWHFAVFMKKEYQQRAREIMRHYALQVDGNEKGAKEKRFDAKTIDWTKGSAAGYLAKYISKNIDGFAVGDDLYGNDAMSSAKRVDA